MLPVKQDIQFLRREINLTQSDKFSLQKQLISATQVNNVQAQPSTNGKARLCVKRLGTECKSIGKQRQREMLASLLPIMLGQEKLHFEEQIAYARYSRNNERFRNLELVSAALRTQSALFSVKTRIAELIALKEEKAEDSIIRKAKDAMVVTMVTFYKSGVSYYQLLDEANSQLPDEANNQLPDEANNEKQNQLSGKKKSNRKGYAPYKKERAEKALKASNDVYEEKCRKRNLTDHQIIEYMREYLYEKRFISQTSGIFCSLTAHEILDIVKSIEIPQIPVSQESFTQPLISSHNTPFFTYEKMNVGQQDESEILKKSACESFWPSLERKLTKDDLIKKFYQFVYTDWSGEYKNESELTKKIIQARREGNLSERYKLLLQKWFQRKLKANTIILIYHILKVKEYQLELKKLNGTDLDEKLNQLNYSISRINKIIEENYKKNYVKFQNKEAITAQLTENNLEKIEKSCKYISSNFRLFENYISLRIPHNLNYINAVLKFLKKQEIVTVDSISALVYSNQSSVELLNNESDSQSRAALGKRPLEFSQEQDLPLQKKRLVEDTLPAERISLAQSCAQVDSECMKITEQCGSDIASSEPFSLISFAPLSQQALSSMSATNFQQRNLSLPMENAEYLESAARKIETDQRYRNIYYDLLSVGNTAISDAEITYQPVSVDSFQDSEFRSQGESEPSASRIETEFESLEPISQNDEGLVNLSASEEDESELQDIFPEIDLQTHISAELDDIDFDDPELLNSLDHILSDHLYQL